MRIWTGLIWALLAGSAGCASSIDSVVQLPGTVALKVGGGAQIAGSSWTVKFDSVSSDSRCPLGVFCIQAGAAVLVLELVNPLVDPAPGSDLHFQLGATPVLKYGFRFTQVELWPIRRQNDVIDPKRYLAKIMIEAVTP